MLEVGTGEGRLSDVVQSKSLEYVGTDINPSFLRKVAGIHENGKVRLLSSNLYHLPFEDCSFSTVVMIRVFNFLSRPISAMLEIMRILAPGGSLIMSYNPKPSIATLADDIKAALRYSDRLGDTWKPVTFSSAGMVRLQPSVIPAYVVSVRYFNKLINDSGFFKVAECASGLEDYRFVDRLPTELFQKLAFALYRIPAMPTRFVLAKKINGDGEFITDRDKIYCCPQCRNPISIDEHKFDTSCIKCSFEISKCEGLPDLRYFSD
jgi:SAM-dependent methyltransferase